MSRHDAALTVDEAILVAEYHPEVNSVLDAYARASRAATDHAPTSRADAWGGQ